MNEPAPALFEFSDRNDIVAGPAERYPHESIALLQERRRLARAVGQRTLKRPVPAAVDGQVLAEQGCCFSAALGDLGCKGDGVPVVEGNLIICARQGASPCVSPSTKTGTAASNFENADDSQDLILSCAISARKATSARLKATASPPATMLACTAQLPGSVGWMRMRYLLLPVSVVASQKTEEGSAKLAVRVYERVTTAPALDVDHSICSGG